MTKKPTLHYFNARGLGEPIRYMLAYVKVDYVDHRFEAEEWPQIKPQMPSGKVPVLEIDGKSLTQSSAALLYLASEHGLPGCKGSWEMAKLEEVNGMVADIGATFESLMYVGDAKKKEEIREELITKTWPESLGQMAHIAQLDQGNKFILGDKPSWADFKLAAMTEFIDGNFMDGNFQKLNKHLADHLARLQALPGVKEYIAKRPQTTKENSVAATVITAQNKMR